MAPAPPLLDPEGMAAFVDPLPIPEVSKPAGKRPNPAGNAQVPFYRIPIGEFFSKVHRDVRPTRFWGYGNSVPGPTIEARSGEDILVDWPNLLPARHFLPIDHNLMGAATGRPESRTVVHVHGGRVPPESDGWPEDAYEPGKSATYHYPNNQEAAVLWYHDHAMGINRLNICAGMAGLYLIRDSFEDSLNLPKGDCEIPLVLMDRMIRTDGQLYYPVSEAHDAPWVPEYFWKRHADQWQVAALPERPAPQISFPHTERLQCEALFSVARKRPTSSTDRYRPGTFAGAGRAEPARNRPW